MAANCKLLGSGWQAFLHGKVQLNAVSPRQYAQRCVAAHAALFLRRACSAAPHLPLSGGVGPPAIATTCKRE